MADNVKEYKKDIKVGETISLTELGFNPKDKAKRQQAELQR